MDIKCIGCYELRLEELQIRKGILVVYNCSRYFPYACALSGLLHPGSGILEAVKDCPDDPLGHCVLCTKPGLQTYGEPNVAVACKEHDAAWSKWLNEHPERRVHLAPRGRAIKANWLEVFREFIEDMRQQAEGIP